MLGILSGLALNRTSNHVQHAMQTPSIVDIHFFQSFRLLQHFLKKLITPTVKTETILSCTLAALSEGKAVGVVEPLVHGTGLGILKLTALWITHSTHRGLAVRITVAITKKTETGSSVVHDVRMRDNRHKLRFRQQIWKNVSPVRVVRQRNRLP